MSYRRAAEFIVRQVGTVLEPKFVLVLSDDLGIDVTDENPVQMTKSAASWLKEPYTGSSRSYPVRNLRPDWHPEVMRIRVPCIPTVDISSQVRCDVRIVSLTSEDN